MRFFLVILLVIFTTMCGVSDKNVSNNNNAAQNSNADSAIVPISQIEIVREFPHDPEAFTQGLVWYQGSIYEGTGGSASRGDSFKTSLRKVDLDSGRVLREVAPPEDVFGEGIAVLNDKVYQLSWLSGKAFRYNLADFKFEKEFTYVGEGWGLTTDGKQLIQTDKTNRIRFVDPETWETVRTIDVVDEHGTPINELNELDWVKGEIWANVWQTTSILRIDPSNGKLLGRIDLDQISRDEAERTPEADVLNGIAYDAESNRLFITGKKWSRLFEIRVDGVNN